LCISAHVKPSRYGSINLFRKIWAFTSSLLSGFIYDIKYETQIDWSKTYIVCPNHTSNLDITAMCKPAGQKERLLLYGEGGTGGWTGN
jgi:1-acyl-sn-glycerol-3-phosphate acyltransferase